MTKTVYDVIDFGVNYIRSVYDDWDVVEVLDKDDAYFQIHCIGNMDMC